MLAEVYIHPSSYDWGRTDSQYSLQHPRYRLLVSEILQTFLLYLGRHGDSVTPMTKEVGMFFN